MSKGRDRTVSRRPDGTWEKKRNDADKASSLQRRRRKRSRCKAMLKNQGGGELTTKGVDGKIRSKDTIAPGKTPIRRKIKSTDRKRICE